MFSSYYRLVSINKYTSVWKLKLSVISIFLTKCILISNIPKQWRKVLLLFLVPHNIVRLKEEKNRQIENQKENNGLYIPWNVNFKGCFFFCNHLWITPPKLMQLHDRTTYTKLIRCPYFVCKSSILFCQETIVVFGMIFQLNLVKV